MMNLFREINRRINGLIWSLLGTGIILLLLGVLVAWTDFVLRLVFALIVITVSYVFIYGAYKLWSIKKEIERHFKI